MITRRSAARLLAGTAVASSLGMPAFAADKEVQIGFDFSLTGGDAESAQHMRDGALMAIDEANAKATVKGYKLVPMILDDATATAGGYDPAQAATNARKFASDKTVVAAVGPQMSGAGKAMAPILSQADLAIITPSSTNPDLTDPKFAAQYRPAGKAIYFRTVTTDAYQGPNMADFFAEKLGVKAIYILDDQGAYGVGLADAFQKRITDKGVKVLGRDQLDPKNADYSAVLTKIKSLNADSLYYGGVGTAGVKLIKQSYDIVPNIIKGGGDGIYGADLLKGAGFPAIQGWYATIAAPHLVDDSKMANWTKAFRAKYNGEAPEDYTITSYDAATVVIDAIAKVAATGKPVTRSLVRDAIQTGKFETLQGTLTFDANGDLQSKVVSVFQCTKNDSAPLDDTNAQFKYIGVAPTSWGAPMTSWDLLVQQVINGLSLGAMYSLIALGFTLVYGILELINFSHFNVFMVGSFVALYVLEGFGLTGQSAVLSGFPLVGVLVTAFVVTMVACGFLGVGIERLCLRPLRGVRGPSAMITTIGVSYVLFNVVLLFLGAETRNYPNPLPPLTFAIGGAVLRLREILIWAVAVLLMLALFAFTQRSRMGKAMRATAQDAEAARMMGVEVDRVVMMAFFIGSALAGAGGMIFGLYYNFTNFSVGYSAGLRAFTAAVLGGIGNVPGAMLGGVLIGLIETTSGQVISVRWTDVVIFAILVLVLVFRPAGLLGRVAPNKS